MAPLPETVAQAERLAAKLIAVEARIARAEDRYHTPIPGKPEHGTSAMKRVKIQIEAIRVERDQVIKEIDGFVKPTKANAERRQGRLNLWNETINRVRQQQAKGEQSEY